jgi:tetratricopeptide (TPR) repeat protein
MGNMLRLPLRICCLAVAAVVATPQLCTAQAEPATIADAYRLFYNAHYEEAAALAESLRESDGHDLENDEVRTSALLFQLRGLLKGEDARDVEKDKKEALKKCGAKCTEVLASFTTDLHHGQALARERLKAKPDDLEALFFLGKLDLNYVWLQLGLLGHKTGWDEYWEARKSLDAVLKANPKHVRARVARGWIDYIVNTRMPWGTRWVLGGGNKKRGIAVVREATTMDGSIYELAEAEFALWDLHVREKDFVRATELAEKLARTFPDNKEVAQFLTKRAAARPTK